MQKAAKALALLLLFRKKYRFANNFFRVFFCICYGLASAFFLRFYAKLSHFGHTYHKTAQIYTQFSKQNV